MIKRIGLMPYRLGLSDQLVGIYNIFNISILRKHFRYEEESSIVDLRGLYIQQDMITEVQSVRNLDIQEKGTRRNMILL